MDQQSFIDLVEEGGFDPNNACHVDALQTLIDTVPICTLGASWKRFALKARKAGMVTIGGI